MKTIHLKFFSLMFLVLILGCKKEINQDRLIDEGKYSGTFKVVYSPTTTITGPVTVDLRTSTYNSSWNPNRAPAGGSGNYSVDNNRIKFDDINYWTADFDWNLILNGEYNYSFDGHNLIISANKNNVGYYEYSLVKQ